MPIFSIESDVCLGMSHTGSVMAEGESTVELTDVEVQILIDLIRENESTDVDDLELEDNYPELYEKLREAYYNMAYDAEETHWLWHGYECNCFEYDRDELIDYCKSDLGFVFEHDEADYLDEDGVLDEDWLEEDEYEAFDVWLDDYLSGLSDDEAKDFFYNHMNADLELDDVDYTVEIPEAIIKAAEEG